jgi:hypothetical protein
MPLASAAVMDTEIKIKTFPNHEVQVTPYKGSNYFKVMKDTSDEYGDISLIFNSTYYDFNLIVTIKKDGETIYKKNYWEEVFYAGNSISLKAPEKGFEFIETPSEINETDINNTEQNLSLMENETELSEEETESKGPSFITGFAIGAKDLFLNKWLYISLGAIALLIAGYFLLKNVKKKPSASKEIKIKKLSDLHKEKEEKIDDSKQIIEDAERKIKEAQDEIRKLKNQDKIKEVEKRMLEDQRELRKLRGE